MNIKNRKEIINEQNGYKQDIMEVDNVEFTFDFGGLQDYPCYNPDSTSRNMKPGYLQGYAKFEKKWVQGTSFDNIENRTDVDFNKDIEKWKMKFIKKSLKLLN